MSEYQRDEVLKSNPLFFLINLLLQEDPIPFKHMRHVFHKALFVILGSLMVHIES